MKRYQTNIISKYFIISLIFISILFINVSSIQATDSTVDENPNEISSVSISTISSKTEVSEFVDLYSSIISNSQLNYKTIDLNGEINKLAY